MEHLGHAGHRPVRHRRGAASAPQHGGGRPHRLHRRHRLLVHTHTRDTQRQQVPRAVRQDYRETGKRDVIDGLGNLLGSDS